MTTFPFEVSPDNILDDMENYIDAVFACLESEFLKMPKGMGFVEYPVFERGYEAFKTATSGFSRLKPSEIMKVILSEPISIVVLRTILGFSPPEWAYLATQKTGIPVTQGFIRSLDRKARMDPDTKLKVSAITKNRIRALIKTACALLKKGAPVIDVTFLHRLDKADTKFGIESIRNLAKIGVPYAMLLCERFLGRPFAGHRDSISELIGDSLESAIEDVLTKANISFRKTKRAERIEGFDQTPDFITPSEFNPQVIIEAKITEDDGTARDKVTVFATKNPE